MNNSNGKHHNDTVMQDSLQRLAFLASGKAPHSFASSKNPLTRILESLGATDISVPDDITDDRERIEYALRPHNIMYREVELDGAWWKQSTGSYLAWLEDGTEVALIPNAMGKYRCYDENGTHPVRVDTSTPLKRNALYFYKSFPSRKLGAKEVFSFIWSTITKGDILLIILATLFVSLLGLLTPAVNKLLFNTIIPSNLAQSILPACALLVGAAIGTLLFGVFRSLVLTRMRDKISVTVENATMARIFSLPASFFKKYSSGDLLVRQDSVNSLVQKLSEILFTTLLSALFSLVYVFQMNVYAPSLVVPGILISLAMLALIIATAMIQTRLSRRSIKLSAKLRSIVLGLFGGVQKIKLAGAEKRAFSKWADVYAQDAEIRHRPPAVIKYNSAISTALTLLGTIVLFWFADTSDVSTSDYIAFSAAYGSVSAALLSLGGIVSQLASIKPQIEMAKPLFDETPETDSQKKQVTSLTGRMEMSNIFFRYDEEAPSYLLDDFSLQVHPGEYIAIVGKSGCGKSTLMRLLTGLETPETGAIYYDGENLEDLNVRSVRRRFGIVLQKDKLFSGTIFDNISITRPGMTEKEAWNAATLAGIAADIEEMPMGMYTVISEGSGSISGGQRQRLLIARAIAGQPDILLFDEATSALDNITQEKVAKNIAALGCTRIVIAHRLSTVRECDRILLLDNGKILEEGSYDELMERKGRFYEFVLRQV
ncbi:NHLP bacteriocin export ABC transporter permease/ATPase subunit [Christensenellaceae bacterium OttesenSCG-928-K19]|nr:NHLP bacteriocin export ABC transporter permease/ATPase subunit [Christensenellaceae bacterium OttesenSCG-928-K19]